ncbi:MAG: hypothetical protein AABX12_00665 [Nanoarchaeota archaeon]
MRKLKKLIVALALIGGIYAFIPFIGFIYWRFYSPIGEIGISLFTLPPFWPVFLTFGLIGSIFVVFFEAIGIKLNNYSLEITANILNIILWIVIGALIGKVILNKRGGSK